MREMTDMELNKQIMKKSGKPIASENDSRKAVLSLAKTQGCYNEALKIFENYDRLLRGCTNDLERKQIAVMGIAELHKLLNVSGALVVDGIEILPAIK